MASLFIVMTDTFNLLMLSPVALISGSRTFIYIHVFLNEPNSKSALAKNHGI